ncbi:hypothetical protein O6H91_10G022600 [Diphasiastrum complanatum]|uniref:Uncharacterized protein n=1 Tax=Diphasiastrum complanatum TaxID=34168 RepID=A0ACC2CF47_DIPCM|nr:hypothetical protein O6H91_10G022600 [Diphasiastrum complanatum]
MTNTPESCFHRYCSSRLASKCTKQFRSAKESLSLSRISDRLLGPTFTSATKICSVSQKEAKEESRSPHELSSKMQELYMRLYNEYYLHKQRMDEVKKLYLEDYKREIQRGKPLASVKTRKFKSDRQEVAKQFQNYGDMLYQEGLLRDGEKRKYIEMKRREIEVAELKELTALPEISKLARQIKRGDEPVWDRLVHQRPNEDHLQELRCEVLQAQLMECTFRPRINQKLENLQDTKKVKLLHVSRFDQLFWDAEHRRKRRTGYGEWYPNEATFRPMINKSPKQSCSIAEVVQHRSVFDRLLEYAARVNEKRHKLYLSQEQLVDQETGQKLFQPLTGGKPLAKRNTDALPIGIFLHHLKPVYDSRRECLIEEDTQEFKKLANRRYVGAKSARLLKELRERSLRDIFHYLDTDKDGFVDLATANTELLTDEVVQNISELKKMQYDTDEHLSFEKFVQLMHIVWRRRRSGFHVVFRHSKACHGKKFAFQFKMDQYSRILAYHKRRFRSSKQWYKIILKDKQRRQAKVEAMRKERESIEMDACPFRPVMLKRFGRSRLKLA